MTCMATSSLFHWRINTVTSHWFTTICLLKLLEKLQQKHLRSGIKTFILHTDNTSAHSAQKTVHFLKKKKLRCRGHPPYSPDLVSCNYFMFLKTKEELRGTRFQTSEAAVAKYTRVVKAWSEEAYAEAYQKWLLQMQLCIEASGHYFEKLQKFHVKTIILLCESTNFLTHPRILGSRLNPTIFYLYPYSLGKATLVICFFMGTVISKSCL